MSIRESLKSAGCVLVVALFVVAPTGCSTSREQPPAENTASNAAPTPAAQVAAEAKSKPAKHVRSAESSGKSGSALILSEIHLADLKEIAIGRMAQQKSATDEVREYAVQLVNDHTSADHQVIALAQKKNVHLRDKTYNPETEHSKLNALSGPSFDKSFLQQAAAEQDRLVRNLKQQREDANDDDVEALIDKILPILEQDKELTQVLIKKEQA
jgi:putative membrane protein